MFQQLLGTNLPAPARAWVLLIKGESDRVQGNRDDARTQFDMAQKADRDAVVARQAAVRQALVNFELREFAEAVAELTPVVNARTPPEVRRAALLLQGEAAYHAGDQVAASTAFRRLQTRGGQLLQWFPELGKTLLREGEPGLESVLNQINSLRGEVRRRAGGFLKTCAVKV